MFFGGNKTLVLALWVLAISPLDAHPKSAPWPSGQKVRLELSRGGFDVLLYPAKLGGAGANPKALIVFGTGCSGWSYWEERVCCDLQAKGYEVLGIDFALYAQTDYNLSILESDYQKIVQYGLKACGNRRLSVILGGWSTGAEQAVAVAGGPHPPSGLVGLLLVSPGNEGGYGTYATNYIDWNTPASKLFKVSDFASRLSHLRIAQWHAELDPLDSRAWLGSLPTTHREFDFDDAIHDYRGACDDFLARLNKSVSWILNGESGSRPSAPQRLAGSGAVGASPRAP
ncbi:MAG: hypothetical protein LV480_11400 [Methylacidiphilales bacterium]|nr:hypothetical protein [Candidatus Methylacidiphilales bacterium]